MPELLVPQILDALGLEEEGFVTASASARRRRDSAVAGKKAAEQLVKDLTIGERFGVVLYKR